MVPRFVILALVISSAAVLAAKPLPGVGGAFGYVADAESAIRVAIAVWEPLYGKQHIASERPYRVTLRGGIWHVAGSLPPLAAGGVAEADIRRSDGKVLRIMHGK
jgi:hypothetical protein